MDQVIENNAWSRDVEGQPTYTNDNSVEQGSCVARSNTVEQHRGVEDDGIDSSELLEHHEKDGDRELGAVLGLEQVAHGVGG